MVSQNIPPFYHVARPICIKRHYFRANLSRGYVLRRSSALWRVAPTSDAKIKQPRRRNTKVSSWAVFEIKRLLFFLSPSRSRTPRAHVVAINLFDVIPRNTIPPLNRRSFGSDKWQLPCSCLVLRNGEISDFLVFCPCYVSTDI